MIEPALMRIENLSKQFVVEHSIFGNPIKTAKAVDGVSLEIAKGETLALVGESGCGKSTLGRLILRLIEPSSGKVLLEGTDITALGERRMRPLRRRIQLIFQDPFASLNPRMTVAQTIAEPLMLHDIVSPNRRRARVVELLESVGLSSQHVDRYPHEFSGGQRQRIAIARALAAEPELIVCDEPVSALDVSIRSQVLNLLRALQKKHGFSYLFISHDLGTVRHIADRVAVMYLGRIVELGTTEQVFAAPCHPYTRALIASIPLPVPDRQSTLPPVEGDLPSPIDPPAGCHFHTRCLYAADACRQTRPQLTSVQSGHVVACHRREELPPASTLESAGRTDPRLESLFSAFHSPRAAEACS